MIKRKDIKYRVGSFKSTPSKDFATFLVYIDARTAMDELDLKFGENNWKFRWEKVEGDDWAIKGYMSVLPKPYTDDKKWITREDVGYPQEQKKSKKNNETEWLKDAVSDALKRCAVQFGVGRELYDAPFLYTEEVNTYEKNGKKYINNYEPLNDMGKKMIEGNINKWYEKLNKNEK